MSKLVVGSATDVGLVRANNQDQLLVCPGLYAVADGMGGHAAGEVASLTAIRALRAAFEASDQRSATALADAAKAANRAIWEQARANREMFGMGTTLVAVAVVERDDGTNGLALVHIGDSRVYLLRDGALRQLTVDHSLVQELVDDGQISQAQAAVHPQRHVLTRALGVEPAADVDLLDLSPNHGDRYVLCSDGLSREASDDQIAAVLRRFADPSEAARELVALARSRGGSDNITVVVVDVRGNDDGPDGTIAVTDVDPRQPSESDQLGGGQYPTGDTGPGKAPQQNWRRRPGPRAPRRARRRPQREQHGGSPGLLPRSSWWSAVQSRGSPFMPALLTSSVYSGGTSPSSRATRAACSGSARPSSMSRATRELRSCPPVYRRCKLAGWSLRWRAPGRT